MASSTGDNTINLALICYIPEKRNPNHLKSVRDFFLKRVGVESIKFDDGVKLDCPALELDDDHLHVYGVNVSLGRLTSENFKNFARQFCHSSSERRNSGFAVEKIWLSCEPFVYSTLLNGDAFETKQKVSGKYFNMGTIVNMNDFVYHYRSDCVEDHKTVSQDDMFVVFEHSQNEVHLHFRVHSVPKKGAKMSDYNLFHSQRYKMEFKYDAINSLLLNARRDTFSVMFFLSCTPVLYALEQDRDPYQNRDMDEISNEYIPPNASWIRVLRFPGVITYTLGKCNVLEVCLKEMEEGSEHKDISCPWAVISVLQKFRKIGAYFTSMKYYYDVPPDPLGPRSGFPRAFLKHPKSFDVFYALESIQSTSFQFINDLDFHNDFFRFKQAVIDLIFDDSEALEEALYELGANLQRFSISRVFPTFIKYFKRQKDVKLKETRSVFSGTTKIKRAILTPTKVIFLPPYPFLDSRFVRQSNSDYLLRVLIRDDDDRLLTFSLYNTPDRAKKEFFEDCLKKPFQDGIRVHDRRFEFVGSSQSQLRENGFLMYAKDPQGRTAEDLRNSLGRITERNVSKYVARIGLMLSQALSYLSASEARIKYKEKDITNPKAVHPVSGKPYIFSDGVGKVSVAFAEKICVQLRKDRLISEDREMPSAYQIRLGGCKGMIAVDPKLKDYDIVLRESMQKFESNDTFLGILKVSDVRAVYLNKPLITCLEQLGTKQKVFREMQFDVLKNIMLSFLYESSAVEILQQYSSLHSVVNFKELVNSGVRILNDPFFRFTLDVIVKKATEKLRNNARIQIPLDSGRTMFGIVDETFTLKYGQVFVQPSNRDDPTQTRPLVRKVLVSKFPCMHPGDVRFFDAVDVKELHHIKDCIVFPAKGSRPHPNEMAGSDLDGDEYAVIWYEPLYFTTNQPAMMYPDSPAPKLDRPITMEDIVDFYIRFIQDYSVGVIASAHLAWADLLVDGIFSKKCMKLAQMYSVSLDFAKTGLNCKLERDDRVKNYPDFMDKFAQKSTYLSKRALGSLNRQICVFQLMFNERIPTDINVEPNRLFVHPNSNLYRKAAEKAYKEYVHYISHLQRFFNIDTEFSVVSGAYTKTNKEMSNQDKFKDSQRAVGKAVSNVFRLLQEEFEKEFAHLPEGEVEESKLAKASAYYFTTFELNKTAERPYYGLPWVFHEYLNILAQRNKVENSNLEAINDRRKYFANLIDQQLDVKPENCGNAVNARRIDFVIKVLQNWLNDQVILQLGTHHSENVLLNYLIGVVKIYGEPYLQENAPGLSVGEALLHVFYHLMDKEFSPNFVAESRDRFFKYSLGFMALLAVNRLYRMQSISHILPQKETVLTSSFYLVSTRTFNLSFKKNEELYLFIVKNEKTFCEVLKALTSTPEIKGRWGQKGSRERPFYYYLLTAFGTPQQLYALSHFLSRLLFSRGHSFIALMEKAIAGRF